MWAWTYIGVDTNACMCGHSNQILKTTSFYLFLQKLWANFSQIYVITKNAQWFKRIILDNISCLWLSYFALNLKNIMKSLAHILQTSHERICHIEPLILAVCWWCAEITGWLQEDGVSHTEESSQKEKIILSGFRTVYSQSAYIGGFQIHSFKSLRGMPPNWVHFQNNSAN